MKKANENRTLISKFQSTAAFLLKVKMHYTSVSNVSKKNRHTAKLHISGHSSRTANIANLNSQMITLILIQNYMQIATASLMVK